MVTCTIPEFVYEPIELYDCFMIYGGGAYKYMHRMLNRAHMRTMLCERQNHRCCYCGYEFTSYITASPKRATFEHVQRRADGGEDIEDNIVIACNECNSQRGEIDAYDYWGADALPHPDQPELFKAVDLVPIENNDNQSLIRYAGGLTVRFFSKEPLNENSVQTRRSAEGS